MWFPYQLAFFFHRRAFLPTSFSMNSNILLPLHELSAKQHKSYQVTFIKFLSRERGDVPSLHYEFIQIPTLDADLCQSWMAVPVVAPRSFTAIVSRRAQKGLSVAYAELLFFKIGPRECLDSVHGSERLSVAKRRSFTYELPNGEASLTNSISFFLLPGAMKLVAFRFYTAESGQITPFRPTDRHLNLSLHK